MSAQSGKIAFFEQDGVTYQASDWQLLSDAPGPIRFAMTIDSKEGSNGLSWTKPIGMISNVKLFQTADSVREIALATVQSRNQASGSRFSRVVCVAS